MTLLPVVLAMIVMYYFLIAMPQRKRQRQRDDMFKAMKRGDEVLTAGGIYGKITAVTDSTVTLEIAPKIKIKVLKSAVTQVVVQAAVEEETKE